MDIIRIGTLAIVAAIGVSIPSAYAQKQPTPNLKMTADPTASMAPLYVIAHIDVMPPYTADAKTALAAYVAAARAENGALRIETIEEVFDNHFDLVEVWRDAAAYRAHLSAPSSLRMRRALAPRLGSPFNERLGTDITQGRR